MKKWASWVLAAALCFGGLALGGVTASAATSGTSGIYVYTVDDDNQLEIFSVQRVASGSLLIPSTIDGYPVTSIGRRALAEYTGLSSVTIPNSVTSIGTEAFLNCMWLTSVTMPNSLTSIGEGAFDRCRMLTDITIPSSVTYIGDFAFSQCNRLTAIVIPNGVTRIGDHTLAG